MSPLKQALRAAPAAAVLGALCDAVLGRAALGALHGAADGFWFAAHLLTAHLPLAYVLALFLGSVVSSWRQVEPPLGLTRHDLASAGVAGGAVLATAGLIGVAGSGLVREMANPLLGALATGLLVVLGTTVAAVAVGPAAWLIARRLLADRRSPVATVAVVAGAIVAGGLAWIGPRVEWGALPLAGLLPLLFVAAALGVVSRRPPPVAVSIVGALFGVIGLVQALSGFPGAPAAGDALLTGPPAASRMLLIGRSLLDGDADGYSAALGGGDCDDADASVGPAADEIPGNGVDDDCLDGDAAKPPPPPVEPAVPLPPPSAPAAGASADNKRPNILFILVDTLRADHLGAWGHDRATSPSMDALAAQSVRFSKAYAQSPHTPRSIPSIFTSRLPSRIALDGPRRSYPRLKDEAVTMAEGLKAAGYRTEGVFSHFYWDPKRNVLQGFDRADNAGAKDVKGSNRDISAPRIFARFEKRLQALAAQETPWFVLVHYFEPHSTYLRHKPPHDFGGGWMDKYDGEIHFVDEWVGRTLAALDGSAAKDDTVVVLTSDHGEGNGEHGFKWHGQHIYDEVLHVPLIVRAPGSAPAVIDTPVALMDIAPTLVELAGAQPSETFEGRSLVAALKGQALAPRPLRAELLPYPGWKEHIQAVVDPPLKLIRNRTKNTWELFDLSADPREQKNLYRDRADDAARLRALLTTPSGE